MSRTVKEFTEIHKEMQKHELLSGISRTYQPADEDGEQLPPESKQVQVRVTDKIRQAREALIDLLDVVITQDAANCEAKADLVVDGKTLAKDVPVTNLLFLEKQLTDLHTFIDKLPTLDPAEEWTFDKNKDFYVTPPTRTVRTKKVSKPIVLHPPTKEHPAQTQLVQEDVTAGHWSTVKFSGAVAARDRNEMLARVNKLSEAVKFAREQANSNEVKDRKIGAVILDYLFGK
ncbi:MAG TPA: hypothetical protein VLJ39_08670 [Tepidisphaeraceae bacterium]|nr:hypothetical protein [Tepidisphaeraceae bacterium]